MDRNNLVHLRVWGRLACFTRPEMKVERVSYPLITPSAARGILEAILWKPEMFYIIDSIRILRKGLWTYFKRNEVQSRISFSKAKSAMLGKGDLELLVAGAGSDEATPRNTLALKDVEYIISAEIRLTKLGEAAGESLTKYLDEFKRRAQSGKCFHRPCLGMREFDADFALVDSIEDFEPAEKWTEDLGLMLYDLFLPSDRHEGFKFMEDSAEKLLFEIPKPEKRKSKNQPKYKGFLAKPTPLFFHAKVTNSVMDCHPDRVKIYGGNK